MLGDNIMDNIMVKYATLVSCWGTMFNIWLYKIYPKLVHNSNIQVIVTVGISWFSSSNWLEIQTKNPFPARDILATSMVEIARLYAAGLNAIGCGEDPWALVPPVKAYEWEWWLYKH